VVEEQVEVMLQVVVVVLVVIVQIFQLPVDLLLHQQHIQFQ
jgi:hypothetical protein